MEPDASQTVVIVDGYSTGQFFIEKIRDRGYQIVYVVSIPAQGPGITSYLAEIRLKYADLFLDWIEEGEDFSLVLNAVQQYHPCAVIVGAESGVELADRLAEALHLPGNGTAKSEARRNKFLMQQALRDEGVPAMKYLEAHSAGEILAWRNENRLVQVVIKPLKSAATQGLHICRTDEEITAAWNALNAEPDIFGRANTTVLVEEYLAGTEYVVNTVSYEGKHYVTDMWEYRKIQIPAGSPVYDYCRIIRYPDEQDPTYALIPYMMQVLPALGIVHGPAHSEVMLTRDGPRLIETGARVMGGSLSPDLLTECIGHNQVDLTIDCHLDPEQYMREAQGPYVIREYLIMKPLISYRSGTVRDIPLIHLLPQLPSAYSGDLIHVIESGSLPMTIDLLTSPGTIFLKHPVEAVVMADYQTISDLETEHYQTLFELEDDTQPGGLPDEWYLHVPPDAWQSDERTCSRDAFLLSQYLDLQPGQEVLDCPCGDGRVDRYLAQQGCRIVGVDASQQAISRARERFGAESLPGEFLSLDMRELSFSERFDAVVNWHQSFGYFGPEHDLSFLRGLVKSLKPGGKILIDSTRKHIVDAIIESGCTGCSITERWNHKEQVVEYTIVPPEEKDNPSPLRVRIYLYSPAEYRLMMRVAGLEQIEMHHVSDGAGEMNHRVIITGKKPKDPDS